MLIKYIKLKSQPDQKTSFVFQQHGTILLMVTSPTETPPHWDNSDTNRHFCWVRVLPRKKQQSHMPSPVTGQNGDRIYVGHA
jgi:hypothetical protein